MPTYAIRIPSVAVVDREEEIMLEYWSSDNTLVIPDSYITGSLAAPAHIERGHDGKPTLRLDAPHFASRPHLPPTGLPNLQTITRPLIILAHGSRVDATFRMQDIYPITPPLEGVMTFVSIDEFNIIGRLDRVPFLSREVPLMTELPPPYTSTRFTFKENIPEQFLCADYGPNWATTRLFEDMRNYRNFLQRLGSETPTPTSVFSDALHLGLTDRLGVLPSRKTADYDIVFIRSGETFLSEVISALYQLGLLFPIIRVSSCRGTGLSSPTYLFDTKERIRRECIELNLQVEYPLRIKTLLHLIKQERAQQTLEVYMNELIFYLRRIIYLVHQKIINYSDIVRNIEPELFIIRTLKDECYRRLRELLAHFRMGSEYTKNYTRWFILILFINEVRFSKLRQTEQYRIIARIIKNMSPTQQWPSEFKHALENIDLDYWEV